MIESKQEVVKQNDEINKIYPYSINTVRLYTLRNTASIKVISGFIRFGVGGMNVDNASSGGFFVPIDLENARLKAKGVQLLKHGGNTFERHPDTNCKFEGFEIPHFKEIVNLTVELSRHFSNKMIGWDIAVGNDEPIFIEGNSNGSLLMSQIACGGFRNNRHYSALLKEI